MSRYLLALLLLALIALPALGEEKINRFDVTIDVAKSGDITVTETINVTAEGNQIQRGIFRDLPRYYTSGGAKLAYDYELIGVMRDGERERVATETDGNAYRYRIGRGEYFLPPGDYTYELQYRVKNQVRYFDDYDEVYWNATGTYWDFPIETARVVVNFPSGAVIRQTAAYTGRQGDDRSDYRSEERGASIIFETTAPLARREGITVAVGIEKGLIDPPSAADLRAAYWQRYGALGLLIASLLGVFGLSMRNFQKVGRDPVKQPIIARYGPPEGYSPAAVHHVYHRGFSGHKALISSLVTLGIKGHVELNTDDKKDRTRITWRADHPDQTKLSKEERLLESKLFSGGDTLELGEKYNSKFTSAYRAFQRDVGERFGPDYFRWNLTYTLIAIALSIGAIVFSLNVAPASSGWIVFPILGIAAINGLFMYLMPAPTEKGQRIRTEIEGFKLYLETAEKLQLNAAEVGGGPPPMTTERYEAFLPYAIALGVEKPWSKYFEKLLPEEAAQYQPSYGHFNTRGGSLANFNRSLVNSISSGVSSSMPQSSGSSGSGGGGFSGGGGGGGGGGGW